MGALWVLLSGFESGSLLGRNSLSLSSNQAVRDYCDDKALSSLYCLMSALRNVGYLFLEGTAYSAAGVFIGNRLFGIGNPPPRARNPQDGDEAVPLVGDAPTAAH